jgi:DNA-binding transcriptional ArsR family regulator
MSEGRALPHTHQSAETHERILESLPTAEEIHVVADSLKQLGDPTRLRIFWLLCHTEECVTDIAEYMEMTSPAVSHHLRLLKTAGLVVTRREGREVLYRVADTALAGELHLIMERIAEISCPSREA